MMRFKNSAFADALAKARESEEIRNKFERVRVKIKEKGYESPLLRRAKKEE